MGVIRFMFCAPVSDYNLESDLTTHAYSQYYRLYGVLLCQGYVYFQTYKDDPVDLKITVSSICNTHPLD